MSKDTTPIQTMIDAARNKDSAKFQQAFNKAIVPFVVDRMETKKLEVASTFFDKKTNQQQ